MHGFEDALYSKDYMDPKIGYRRYIDVRSFAEHFIISELGHNVDAYRLSTYMYKDRNSVDSLLHAGPLWDFNLGYGNVNYCGCENVEGWAYINSTYCGNTPLWWPRLVSDTFFMDEVSCRYTTLREGVLSDERIDAYIDSMALTFAAVGNRNYERWPILGIWIWPNYFIGQTFEEEIQFMKDWIAGRLAFMDENLLDNIGKCEISGIDDLDERSFTISPNPAYDVVHLAANDFNSKEFQISISDLSGKVLFSTKSDVGEVDIEVSGFYPGQYIVSAHKNGKICWRDKLIIIH
jgi:hypothetical protein